MYDIYTNDRYQGVCFPTVVPENVTEIAVPYLSVSDHFPVCFTQKKHSSCPNGPVHKTINYRDTKHFDETLFLQDLKNLPWF